MQYDPSGQPDCHLHSLSFEEYLVSIYFESFMGLETEPCQGLKDYISHVYKKHVGPMSTGREA
jgi:hypothetical protein